MSRFRIGIQLRLRVALGLQTLTVKSRLLPGEKCWRTAIRCESVAAHQSWVRNAERRKPVPCGRLRFIPRSALNIPHSEGSRSSNHQSATLRTSRLQVRVLPGAPIHAACSPTSRGVPLKPGRLQVQILPRGPPFAMPSFSPACHFWNVNRASGSGPRGPVTSSRRNLLHRREAHNRPSFLPRGRCEPLECLRKCASRVGERLKINSFPRQQITPLAGLGVLQNRDEPCNVH